MRHPTLTHGIIQNVLALIVAVINAEHPIVLIVQPKPPRITEAIYLMRSPA